MKKVLVLLFMLWLLPTPAMAQDDCWKEISDPQEAFWAGYFQTVGTAKVKSSEHMAKTGARMRAQARLLEILKGVEMKTTTTMENDAIRQVIQSMSQGSLKGSSVCAEIYDRQTGEAIVGMRLFLKNSGLDDLVEQLIKDKVN